jgi:hypothetical protein
MCLSAHGTEPVRPSVTSLEYAGDRTRRETVQRRSQVQRNVVSLGLTCAACPVLKQQSINVCNVLASSDVARSSEIYRSTKLASLLDQRLSPTAVAKVSLMPNQDSSRSGRMDTESIRIPSLNRFDLQHESIWLRSSASEKPVYTTRTRPRRTGQYALCRLLNCIDWTWMLRLYLTYIFEASKGLLVIPNITAS